jgi:fructose-1-phosphate kinase PfkB-like protein
VDTSGEALRATAGKPVWLLKPNAEELQTLAGRPLPTRDDQLVAARELTATAEWVLLSLGADGAMLVGRDAAWSAAAPLPADQVRNTVGCGDVLLGAFVAAIHQGQSPENALADAVATATAAAAHPATAVFHQELRDQLRTQTTIEEIQQGCRRYMG